MSHKRTDEDRLEAIEEVLGELVRAVRKDENEVNRLLRRLKPPGTYPQPVAMVVAVRQASQPQSKPAPNSPLPAPTSPRVPPA
jgi:hypothetical protein